MATIKLEPDFKEFLRLLNFHQVEYLIVGGYAVAHHGYPRTTKDIDIWAGVSDENAAKLCQVFVQFGFSASSISASKFLDPQKVYRMGVPPVCIDLLLNLTGLEFAACFTRRLVIDMDGVKANMIRLEDLKTNKRSSGRYRDLDDLEHLP